ncbi:MAG: hypothetical protein PVI23_14735 [Maricaulaceae bacterium]|jgi:hypothetical protein
MLRKTLPIAAALLVVTPAGADIWDGLDLKRCEVDGSARVYPQERFILDLARGHDVPLVFLESGASDSAGTGLGALAWEVERNPTNESCTDDATACEALRQLLRDTETLVERDRRNSDFAVSIGDAAPPPRSEAGRGYDRAVAILNGQAPWLEVHCLRPPPESQGAEQSWLANVHIGGEVDDPERELLDSHIKDFASATYQDDRTSDTQTIGVSALVLFPSVFGTDEGGLGEHLTVRPFIGLQKNRKDAAGTVNPDIEDLSVGLLGRFAYGQSWRYFVTPSLTWESDLELDSSVGIASVGWRPVPVSATGNILSCLEGPAQASNSNPYLRLGCSARLVAEHVVVADAGDKEALADATSFTRAGFDAQVAYDISPAGSEARTDVSLRYARREAFDGEEGDADRMVLALKHTPTETSPWRFSIEYVHGEDLTSLETERSVSFKIEYRRR